MTNQTKAQLQAEIEVLKSQIAELSNQKEKKFNIWENTYRQLVRGFINSGEKTEFSFKAKHLYDNNFTNDKGEDVKIEGVSKVIKFLYSKGALKLVSITPTVDDTGKQIYEIHIKDFNINTRVPGKFGDYNIFRKPYEKVVSQERFKDQA